VEHQETLTNDAVAFRASDIEFHRLLRKTAGNPFLDRVSTFFFVLGTEYRHVHWETPGMLRHSLEDHREIVAALTAGDASRTAAAMERHMLNVRDSTRATM